MKWETDDVFSLQTQHNRLRFVPIAAAFASGRSPDAVRATFQRLDAESQRHQTQVAARNWHVTSIVIYPAPPLEREALPLPVRSMTNSYGDATPTSSKLRIIPVSSLDINSVERVSRAVRSWLADQNCAEYPPASSCFPVHVLERVCSDVDCLLATSPKRAALLRPPTTSQRRTIDAVLTPWRRALISKGARAISAVADIDKFESELRSLSSWFEAVSFCPVCDHRIDDEQSMKALGAGCLQCRCAECNAVWGIYQCGACKERFPFLHVSSHFQSSVRTVGWVDRVLGRDVLAVPCWLPNRERDYICPRCGRCPAGTTEAGICCGRCTPSTGGEDYAA